MEEAGTSLHSGPFLSSKFLLVEDPDFNLKYFNSAILLWAKYSRENFCGLLKDRENRKSLAQWNFPRLQYF